MKTVTLVGPSHPLTGGISQHNTRLALELEKRKISVVLESWKAQYPRALHPGTATVPDGRPEIGIPKVIRRRLTWYNPFSWVAGGLRSRTSDLLIFTVPTPIHNIIYFVFASVSVPRKKRVAILHNVLPHERGPFDRVLMRVAMRSYSLLIVHSAEQEQLARNLGAKPRQVVRVGLPNPWKNIGRSPRAKTSRVVALFFGTIRPYKGLDLLLEALSKIDGLHLLIAGEFWEPQKKYDTLIEQYGLGNRVTVRPGYVASIEIEKLFQESNFVVLPYRSGTGSVVCQMAMSWGLPVIASRTGSMLEEIQDGVTGRLVEPKNVSALAMALREAKNPSNLEEWRKNLDIQVGPPSASDWETYCGVFQEILRTQERTRGGP